MSSHENNYYSIFQTVDELAFDKIAYSVPERVLLSECVIHSNLLINNFKLNHSEKEILQGKLEAYYESIYRELNPNVVLQLYYWNKGTNEPFGLSSLFLSIKSLFMTTQHIDRLKIESTTFNYFFRDIVYFPKTFKVRYQKCKAQNEKILYIFILLNAIDCLFTIEKSKKITVKAVFDELLKILCDEVLFDKEFPELIAISPGIIVYLDYLNTKLSPEKEWFDKTRFLIDFKKLDGRTLSYALLNKIELEGITSKVKEIFAENKVAIYGKNETGAFIIDACIKLSENPHKQIGVSSDLSTINAEQMVKLIEKFSKDPRFGKTSSTLEKIKELSDWGERLEKWAEWFTALSPYLKALALYLAMHLIF